MVYTASGFYPNKAETSNEFNLSAVKLKQYLLVLDKILKNILMHLIWIHSLIERFF